MVVLKNALLIAFEKIASLKTVHAAAVDLGLTQAALTKRIRALEGELGVTLFLRSRRGMSITDEGRALLHFCQTCNEAEGLFLSQIQGEDQKERDVTISGPTSAISTRIHQDCLGLYKKYPFLKLHFRSDDHANLIDLIRLGKSDLAVVSPDLVPNEMDSKLLKPDKYLLVASSTWHKRPLDEILNQERIIDFDEGDQTTFQYLKKFGLEKTKRPDRIFVNENEGLLRMFIAGLGYGTLTETIAKPHIESGKLIKLNRGQVLEHPLALVWYPRTQKADYLMDIIRSIK